MTKASIRPSIQPSNHNDVLGASLLGLDTVGEFFSSKWVFMKTLQMGVKGNPK